ncbi:MAG: hypothetical protein B6U86_04370 [Candidatus Altiarchaeales archaeon ex4484_43]|nr:MAG: hypothetical protein B6U86_04370 [Candidatus Altiarchaeales archaeon ex4484_43]
MEIVTDRTEYEILSILDRKNRAVNSAEIEKELRKIGIDISRRRIVQYLEILDDKGFSENLGREGRRISKSGGEEVKKALVHIRPDYIPYKTVKLSSEMTFDIDKRRGSVVANLSIIDENKEENVIKILKEICTKTNWASPFIKIAHSGGILCDYKIPEGKMGLATVSSMTIDGILINNKVYVIPLYCGLVEFNDLKPVRFTVLAPTKGCSFDPLTIFIGQGKSTVCNAIRKTHGLVVADYREYPNTVKDIVINVLKKTVNVLGGLVIVGKPETSILGISPTSNYGGVSAFGGEILISALEEEEILTDTRTVYSTIDFKELEPVSEVKGEVMEL